MTAGRKSRNKGNRFMWDMCRALSAWVCSATGPIEDLPFRTRSTSIMPVEGHWNGAGDLVHRPDVQWPFCVECKSIEGWEVDGVFQNERWPITDWWAQTVRQARRVELQPLLMFKRNRRAVLVALKESALECLLSGRKLDPVLLVSQDSERIAILALASLVSLPRDNLRNVVTGPGIGSSLKTGRPPSAMNSRLGAVRGGKKS